jgi:hypothetical protein
MNSSPPARLTGIVQLNMDAAICKIAPSTCIWKQVTWKGNFPVIIGNIASFPRIAGISPSR